MGEGIPGEVARQAAGADESRCAAGAWLPGEHDWALSTGVAGAWLSLLLKLTYWLQVHVGTWNWIWQCCSMPQLPGSQCQLASSSPSPGQGAGVTLNTGTATPAGGQLHRHHRPLGFPMSASRPSQCFQNNSRLMHDILKQQQELGLRLFQTLHKVGQEQ